MRCYNNKTSHFNVHLIYPPRAYRIFKTKKKKKRNKSPGEYRILTADSDRREISARMCACGGLDMFMLEQIGGVVRRI